MSEPPISVTEVEAKSDLEKQPGETLAEYLRRVGDQTDLPNDDVEAVIAELHRQKFAGETSTKEDDGAPIEAFIEAVDALGNEADDGETDADSDSTDTEPTDDGGTVTEATPPQSTATAGADEGHEEDAVPFYRSITVLGIVVLLGAGVLGSAILMGTDLGPDVGEPEPPTDAGDLEETADESGESDATDDVPDVGDGDDGADEDDDQPDDETVGDDMDDGVVTDTTEPNDGIEADDVPSETDEDDAGDTPGAGQGDGETEGDDATADGTDGDETDADGVDDADDATPTDQEETDSEVIDSAPAATGSLAVTDRAAPGANPNDEYIELTNVGDTALDISGWTVRDREDDGAVDTRGVDPFEIPEGYVLEPGESVRIVTGSGENTAGTIYWGLPRQFWRQAGDVIIVQDQDGTEVLRETYGDQADASRSAITGRE